VVYRRDRASSASKKTDGGGVLIAISNKYHCKRLKHFESDFEDVWVSIEICFSNSIKCLNICAIYLPPPVTGATLDTFLAKCNQNYEHDRDNNYNILIGDFNLGQIKWCDNEGLHENSSCTLKNKLIDFMTLNALKQLNVTPNAYGNILDLVLTNIPNCEVLLADDVLSKIDSPHPPLVLSITNLPLKSLSFNCKGSIVYDYYKADYNLIKKHLSEINWTDRFQPTSTVDDDVQVFESELWDVIKKYAPIKKQNKRKYPPWFTSKLINLLREKNTIRRRFNKYRNPMDKIELVILKKRCNILATDSYNHYIECVEDNLSKNPKHFWSYIKSKRGVSNSYPSVISDGIHTAENEVDMCQLFASYFASGYNDTQLDADQPNVLAIGNSHNDNLSVLKFTSSQVLKNLKNLDDTKSPGFDNVPPFFIKSCADVLAHPLQCIYNKSIVTGVFPSQWKIAKVVPIPKSGDANSVTNYRPISLLCIFAKVFESLICPFLQFHCKQVFSKHQHGFLEGRSIVTNLVLFEDALVAALDSNSQADVIYTDFSKAFDKVLHCALLKKLSLYGIAGSMLNWFRSYLTDRYFYVVVNGFASDKFIITSGVPQGSHLGPILFNLFVNDICQCFKYSSVFLYADDLKMLRVIKTKNDVDLLQSDLDRFAEWCVGNGMQVNTNKCSQITFTRKSQPIRSQYFVDGVALNETDSVRDLGVIFDKKITFVSQIDQVVGRASKMLGLVIRNGRAFKNPQTKITLYLSIVRSILEYASVIWRPHYAVHMLRIERIQKRFMWHLTYSQGLTKQLRSYTERLKYFKIPSVSERFEFIDFNFVQKIINNKIDCPQLLEKINFRVPRKYPRKTITPLCPPFYRTVLGANSAIPRLCRIANHHSTHTDLFNVKIRNVKQAFYVTIKRD
jgi:hypothetical protein